MMVFDMYRTVNMWLENGEIYLMEEGDHVPTLLEINIYSKDARKLVNLEVSDLEDAGYFVKIGRPAELSDGWQSYKGFVS